MQINKIHISLIMLILAKTFSVSAQDENFHIYLCFGQSNMEGSANIVAQDTTVDSRLLMMPAMDCPDDNRYMNNWYPAIPPLSSCWHGLSPADYFGRTMVAVMPDSIKVGLINVAVGGCDIRLFDKDIYEDYTATQTADWFTTKLAAYDGNPYKRFIDLAKEAQKQGVIKGILLHQGEANETDENWPQYVKAVYENMLKDLNLKAIEVPLLAGEVVNADQGGMCSSMNHIINQLPFYIPTAHVISSAGCAAKEDDLHFNSNGVRKLGRRYAVEMLSILDL
jgi:hypothetical protein